MTNSLQEILSRSAQMVTELDEAWSSHPEVTTQRGLVVLAYCAIVRQHVLSLHRLLASGFDVTAMTLVRPAFESLVRAIWSLDGAQDAWLTRFLQAPAADSDPRNETITGPPVESMLATIRETHPRWVSEALAALKDATWKPMHSYVHGGVRPVLQVIAGCPDQQQIAVARNANGFLMFASNVRQIVCGATPGLLGAIQDRFAGCLPPVASPEP